MSANKKIYVCSVIPRLSELVKEKLPDVEVIDASVITPESRKGKYGRIVKEEEIEALQNAEILLVDNNLLAQMTDRLPNLKWAQGTWAGVEGLVSALKDKPKPKYAVTRMVGDAFSLLMAEYTVGWIISHERDWIKVRENQMKSKWVHEGRIAYYRSLQDLTIGILGMGNIGKEVAKALKTFKAQVHGFTRTPPSEENRCSFVDKYWHTGDLPSFLQHSDYIINIMPSTSATREMLGGDVLKDAKKGAVFMNIGRGDVISDQDIINALDVGWISAAILDVFIPEPLPADNPLWKHPKVIVTPHGAAISRAKDIADIFIAQYKKYVEGYPLMYTVDWSCNY